MTSKSDIRANRQVVIANIRGLHARAAGKFAKIAAAYESAIQVSMHGQAVDGKSILDLLTMGAGPGSLIELEARGADAKEAIQALGDLVEACFGED